MSTPVSAPAFTYADIRKSASRGTVGLAYELGWNVMQKSGGQFVLHHPMRAKPIVVPDSGGLSAGAFKSKVVIESARATVKAFERSNIDGFAALATLSGALNKLDALKKEERWKTP
jgi:hypothetical protein